MDVSRQKDQFDGAQRLFQLETEESRVDLEQKPTGGFVAGSTANGAVWDGPFIPGPVFFFRCALFFLEVIFLFS